jgi:hypothetical protein
MTAAAHCQNRSRQETGKLYSIDDVNRVPALSLRIFLNPIQNGRVAHPGT